MSASNHTPSPTRESQPETIAAAASPVHPPEPTIPEPPLRKPKEITEARLIEALQAMDETCKQRHDKLDKATNARDKEVVEQLWELSGMEDAVRAAFQSSRDRFDFLGECVRELEEERDKEGNGGVGRGKWVVRIDSWPDGTETVRLGRKGRGLGSGVEGLSSDGGEGDEDEDEEDKSGEEDEEDEGEDGEGGSSAGKKGEEEVDDIDPDFAFADLSDDENDGAEVSDTRRKGRDWDSRHRAGGDGHHRHARAVRGKPARKKLSKETSDSSDNKSPTNHKRKSRKHRNHGASKVSQEDRGSPVPDTTAVPNANEDDLDTITVARTPMLHTTSDHRRERAAALEKFRQRTKFPKASNDQYRELSKRAPKESSNQHPGPTEEPPTELQPSSRAKPKKRAPGWDLVPEADFMASYKTIGVDQDPMRMAKKRSLERNSASGTLPSGEVREAESRDSATRGALTGGKRKADAVEEMPSVHEEEEPETMPRRKKRKGNRKEA